MLLVVSDRYTAGTDNERAAEQCRLLHHQIEQFVIAQLSLCQPERFVGSTPFRKHLSRSKPSTFQRGGQFIARKTLLKVVAPLIGDTMRTEELLGLLARRSGWVDENLHGLRSPWMAVRWCTARIYHSTYASARVFEFGYERGQPGRSQAGDG